MSDHDLERISAFVDGESPVGEISGLIDRLEHDSDMQKRWGRYHLIGDAMRNNLPSGMQTTLVSRVAKALENEPTIMAPYTPLSRKYKSQPQRPTAGYAIAASIAIIGFVFIGLVGTRPDPALTTSATVTVNTPIQQASVIATATPAVTLEASDTKEAVVIAGDAQDEQRTNNPKIHAYIVRHEQASAAVARPGLPPNVRAVTFSQPTQ